VVDMGKTRVAVDSRPSTVVAPGLSVLQTRETLFFWQEFSDHWKTNR
jgi:hypothetical protein